MTGPHDPSQIPPQSPYSPQSPYTPYGQPGAGAGQSQSPYGQQPYQGGGQYSGAGQQPYQGAGQFQPQPQPQPPGPGLPYGTGMGPQSEPPKQRNTLGIIALVAAIVGTILACIPGIMFLGWVVLPVSFVLGLVALFAGSGGKGTAIGALAVSVLGTIVGFIMFFFVIADALEGIDWDTAAPSAPEDLSGLVDPYQPGREQAQAQAKAQGQGSGQGSDAAAGTRENPLSADEPIITGDWEIVINEINLNGTAEVLAENRYNEPPSPGSQIALINVTATYHGPQSELADFIWASWVTEDGRVIESFDHPSVIPDPLEGELYPGASSTGNLDVVVPEGDNGLLRLNLGFVDEVFVQP